MAEDLITYDGGVLICDMLLDAQATHTLELTQLPIETGAAISDHAIHRPLTLDLTLVQTDSPISPIDGFVVTSQAIEFDERRPARQQNQLQVRENDRFPVNVNQLIGAVTSRIARPGPITVDGVKADGPVAKSTLRVSALTAGAPVERVNQFYADLLSLMLGVTPLNVTVKGSTHIDMVITSVTRIDSPGQFGAARFQVSLQRVSTVSTQTVELPPVPEVSRKNSRGKKDGEKKAPTDDRSTLKALKDSGVNVASKVRDGIVKAFGE